MGNKPTSAPGGSYPERSLSWQPPANGTQKQPQRRNSFAHGNSNGAVLGAYDPMAPLPNGTAPKGYAASEMDAPRYQKRLSPKESNTKMGQKLANKNNMMRENYYGSVQCNQLMTDFYVPPPFLPPMPMFGPMGPPPMNPMGLPPMALPGPGVRPVRFMGPPPMRPVGPSMGPGGPPMRPRGPPMGPGTLVPAGPPPMPFGYSQFGMPMDPMYGTGISVPEGSKRGKKLRHQKQKRQEVEMRRMSELTRSPPMFAIMGPPPPEGVYGPPMVYRSRSMQKIEVESSPKMEHPKRHANKTVVDLHRPRRSNSQNDVRTGNQELSLYKEAKKEKSDKREIAANVDYNKKYNFEEIDDYEPNSLRLIKDGLIHEKKDGKKVESQKEKVPLNHDRKEKVSNEPLLLDNKKQHTLSTQTPDVIYETLKSSKGKKKTKEESNSPTAINIHFDYNEKDKGEPFVPAVAFVSSEAKTVMERNALRLIEAEIQEQNRPRSVMVNEESSNHLDSFGDENIELQKREDQAPKRKVDVEVFEQRSLHRRKPFEVLTLTREVELVETPTVPKGTHNNESQQNSSGSSGFDENGEKRISPFLKPVLKQSKAKKADEFKALSAWNEINVASDKRYKQEAARRLAKYENGAIDEKIVVHMVPAPPIKNPQMQEPIYLDYGRHLPEYKKRLIETGSYPEIEQIQHSNSSSTLKADYDESGFPLPVQEAYIEKTPLKSDNVRRGSGGAGAAERRRYSTELRSKSNVDERQNALLTPSIAKIKAGDCSDIDFSWVDDLETRFRLEREQFDRGMQNIKERSIQRGVRPIQPVDKRMTTTTSQLSSVLDSQYNDELSLLDNSLMNEKKISLSSQRNLRYANDANKDLEYRREITRPDIDTSSYREEIRRASDPNSGYNPPPNGLYESEMNRFRTNGGAFYESELERIIQEEPIYIPKPDYDQMEAEQNWRESRLPVMSVQQRQNMSGIHAKPSDHSPNYRTKLNQDFADFDRLMTVDTTQTRAAQNRHYANSSLRSPSQRKLNRYYNSNVGNGPVTSNEGEWVADDLAHVVRYDAQTNEPYGVDPRIANGYGDYTLNNTNRRKPYVEDNARLFVENMNNSSPKWSRNVEKQRFNDPVISNGHVRDFESESRSYTPRAINEQYYSVRNNSNGY